jgi:outer membrane protein assembly factor BamB
MDRSATPGEAGGAHLWSKRIRTGVPLHLAGYNAALDGAGSVLITGRFGGRLDLTELGGLLLRRDSGGAFVLKLDASGALSWAHHLVDTAEARPPWSIAADASGNVFLAGEAAGGMVLIKLDPAGERLWTRRLSDIITPAADRQPLGLTADGAGNVLVMGHGAIETAVASDGVLAYLFLLAFDATGIVVHNRRFPCAGRARRCRVAVDGAGNVFASGYFMGTVSFGQRALESAPHWDLYLAKLDAGGEALWSKRLAGKDTSGFGVALDPAGNVVLGGAFQKQLDVGAGPMRCEGTRALFLAKLDPRGVTRFARRYLGDTHSRFEPSLAADGRGGALLAGYLEGAIDFGGGASLRSGREDESVFVAALGEDGEHRWSRCFVGSPDQAGISVLAGEDGSAVVLGLFGGTVDLGGGPLWNAGPGLDLFIGRLAPGPGGRETARGPVLPARGPRDEGSVS